MNFRKMDMPGPVWVDEVPESNIEGVSGNRANLSNEVAGERQSEE